jgi:hypothetical protein
MGHKTGPFFQMARGRAMVRSRAMRLARSARARMLASREDSAAQAAQRDEMAYQVGRARRANRDWRHYRGLAVECGEIDRAEVVR